MPRPELRVYEGGVKEGVKPAAGYAGGGGSGGSGMDQRLTKLESDVADIRVSLQRIDLNMSNGFSTVDSKIAAELLRLETKLDGKFETLQTALNAKVDQKWLALFFIGLAALILRNEIAGFLSGSP